jgi:DNA primase
MALFPQQFIEDLRLQANILQVVQEYVPLRRAGSAYKGLCPFHAEKTPSFQVHPEKGFFHCFGCGAGGDVFKFLELHEKVAFPDAVRMLAQKYGVALPETSDDQDAARTDARLRESLLNAHDAAAAFFREQLASPSGGRARQQLADRGVTPQTADQLGLGFAPPSRDSLKQNLLRRGFTPGLLVQSGLLVQRDSGDVVDRFRNRLMIPICRETGSIVAFGGRSMDRDQVPKYLNSPETAIYSKSRTLYGLNLTKASIRKLGYAVLVEGYFDFAQVFQTQAAPVVASCGTALTPQQAQLLRRFTTKVVLSYDPDAAGQGAAARSCDLLVSEGFDVNVVVLDRGEDPDTFIRSKGPDQYRERLRSSQPYLEYLLDQAAAGLDFSHDESRRQFLNRMLTVASRVPEAAARDQFADRIAHKARVTEEVVRAEIRKAAVGRRPLAPRDLPGSGQLRPAEKGLIWGLFHQTPETLAALGTLEPADFDQLAGREIFEVARSLLDRPLDLLPSELLRRLSTMDAQLVTGIAGQEAPPVDIRTGLAECARALKRMRCERERASVQREIDRLQGTSSTQNGDRIDLLLHQKRSLAQRIEELT